MLIALWPRHWSRQQRSNATLVAALVLMVVMLALLGQILSLFPEPIGSNAQAFSDGARTTLWLTLISGTVGLILGTAAALDRLALAVGFLYLGDPRNTAAGPDPVCLLRASGARAGPESA
jgi:polar amino acid transport system permease protein